MARVRRMAGCGGRRVGVVQCEQKVPRIQLILLTLAPAAAQPPRARRSISFANSAQESATVRARSAIT
jgi:hypothetical protein